MNGLFRVKKKKSPLFCSRWMKKLIRTRIYYVYKGKANEKKKKEELEGIL